MGWRLTRPYQSVRALPAISRSPPPTVHRPPSRCLPPLTVSRPAAYRHYLRPASTVQASTAHRPPSHHHPPPSTTATTVRHLTVHLRPPPTIPPLPPPCCPPPTTARRPPPRHRRRRHRHPAAQCSVKTAYIPGTPWRHRDTMPTQI